jgi:hypothetical protein
MPESAFCMCTDGVLCGVFVFYVNRLFCLFREREEMERRKLQKVMMESKMDDKKKKKGTAWRG